MSEVKLSKNDERLMPSLAEDQLNGVTPENLTKLIELWVRQAKALGYRVRFYPSADFDEILEEEEFSAEKVPNIEGVIFMDADDPDRGIYIREDIHPASQLCALIHETLHAEQPHWNEATVHAATLVQMERIKEDTELGKEELCCLLWNKAKRRWDEKYVKTTAAKGGTRRVLPKKRMREK
jgi:hypothetical protein